MTEPLLTSLGLAVFAALLGVVSALFLSHRKSVKEATIALGIERAKSLTRLNELENKLALVSQAVVPLNLAMQAMLIKELTHYHTPEMDALMAKLGPPSALAVEEEARLAALLDERTRDMGPLISDSERDAAHILPAIIKRARLESETLAGAEAMKLRLVTVAAVVGIPVALSFGETDKP